MSKPGTGSGHHGQSRRREQDVIAKPKTRSRNGCPECKSRRLKCDETKPECQICIKSHRQCSGYDRSFKWSTKYEKASSKKAQGPSNLEQLVSDTSKVLPARKSSPQTQASESPVDTSNHPYPKLMTKDTGLDAESVAWATEGPSLMADANSSMFTDGQGLLPSQFRDNTSPTGNILSGVYDSSTSVFDEFALPDYNHILEELLQDSTSACDPRLSEFLSPVNASSQHWNLAQSLMVPTISRKASPFLNLSQSSSFPPPYQASLSQIPRGLNDRALMLVEEWFRHVCPMWSSFDSNSNWNRRLAHETWTRSEAVKDCLQGMAAICLNTQMPQMRRVAILSLKSAGAAIQRDLVAARALPPDVVPTDVLFALFCVGTAACWVDTNEIGAHFLKDAKALLKRLNENSANLSTEDRQKLDFFNKSIIYWNMLVAVVSDEDDGLGLPSPKPNPQPALASPIVPHPWTGVSSTVQLLFMRAVRLCRRFRGRTKQETLLTAANLQSALKDIQDAQKVEEELLGFEQLGLGQISDTGDEMSPSTHLLDVMEAYRLAALIQLYQTFPDLVSRRLPEDADRSSGHVPWDSWIVPLGLRLVNILRRVPVTSGTRCIQPLLYLSASTSLRFDLDTLKQLRGMQQASSFAADEASRFETGAEPAPPDPVLSPPSTEDEDLSDRPPIAITNLSIDVTYARRFILARLGALEHTLPPAPILVAKKLVKAIWKTYDSEGPGVNCKHWIDVMESSNLRTIFG